MENNDIEKYIDRLQKAYMVTIRRMSRDLMENDPKVTGPQFFILQFLQNNGKITVSSLAEEMTVKPSAITTMIDRLIKQGYVLRDRDDQDRRIVFIHISEAGKEALYESKEKRKQILLKYLVHLDQTEIETLISIYEKLSRVDVKE